MAYVRFGFAGPGDDLPIDQWMDDRDDYVGSQDSFDAAGREAWDASTRSGDNLQASRPSDVVALGSIASRANSVGDEEVDGAEEQPLEGNDISAGASPAQVTPRYVRAAPGDSISGLLGTSDPDKIAEFQQLNGMDGSGSRIYAGRVYALPHSGGRPGPRPGISAPTRYQAAASTPAFARDHPRSASLLPKRPGLVERIVNSPNGPLYAQAAGVGVGVLRGAIHTAQDLGKASTLGMRLMNPTFDQVMAAFGGGTAMDQIAAAGQKIDDVLGDRILHPTHLVQDARNIAAAAKRDLMPGGTPQAPTRAAEAARRFRIGENQGEVGFNAAMVAAAPVSEAAEAASIGSKEEEIARFIRQGHTTEEAQHLAKPYDGMGNHTLARRYGFPSFISDSPFFLQRPTWMNKGRFYERHFQVDPRMYGAKIKNGQRGWSGNRVGLQRFDPMRQFWFGTTPPLRTTIGSVLAGTNLSNSTASQPGHR